LLYVVAAVGLSLTPGPNSLLVLTHGALRGHRKTLFTVCGGALGFLALIALSMMGLEPCSRRRPALTLLKWWVALTSSGWAFSCGAHRPSGCVPMLRVPIQRVQSCFVRDSSLR
jgi:arginine exporter protein ArgO